MRPDVASQPEINKQAPIKMHQWQEAETQQRSFMHGASFHWLLELRREGEELRLSSSRVSASSPSLSGVLHPPLSPQPRELEHPKPKSPRMLLPIPSIAGLGQGSDWP